MTYPAFWLVYLRAHDRAATRGLHYAGSLSALALVAAAAMTGTWWLLPLSVVVGYGFAWSNHFLFEHNRPATFGHPLWSLASDFRMLGLWLSGRLAPHLARARARAARG
jgi:hypothetical protein